MVKGKVVDGEGKPVAGVTITIEFQGGVNRKLTTKTDKRGEFIQLLTESGNYKVTRDRSTKIGIAEHRAARCGWAASARPTSCSAPDDRRRTTTPRPRS